MLICLLKKAFILTTSGKQSSNNCEHMTQLRIEMSIPFILNILKGSKVNKLTTMYI